MIRLPCLLLLLATTALCIEPRWRLHDGTFAELPADTVVGGDSVRVVPRAAGAPVFPVPFSTATGDVISVSVVVEAETTAEDAGAEGQAGVVFTALPVASKTNHNPDAEHRQIAIVGSSAETIRFAFRVRREHAAEQLLLVPTLSYFGRIVRLSSITFTNHGPSVEPGALTSAPQSYRGQEPDAPWRAQAAALIDRHRCADLRVVVTDRLGRPRPGLPVAVDQLRHHYPFGTAVVSSRVIDAPRQFAPDSGLTTEQWRTDNVRYRAELLRLFNTAVTENDLKWPQWDGSHRPDLYQQSWTLGALDWLHENQFDVKGHTLVWGSWRFSPEWLRAYESDLTAVQDAVLAHIRDIGGATADRTRWWDVLNEPLSHRNLIELLGMKRVAEWFQEAHEVMPEARLVMNDFDLVGNGGSPKRRAEFLAFYRELVAHGAPIHVLGLQSHFWSERFTAPEDVWRIIEELHGATGLPLMVSEFDTNIPNEQLQADYTRDFLTAWFAHPATEAFIMWGFWGGAHWMGDAGAMFRRDWTPKPNLAAYEDLVFNQWWTKAATTTTSDGEATVRAFHGRHRITVTAASGVTLTREVDLPPDGRTVHLVVPE